LIIEVIAGLIRWKIVDDLMHCIIASGVSLSDGLELTTLHCFVRDVAATTAQFAPLKDGAAELNSFSFRITCCADRKGIESNRRRLQLVTDISPRRAEGRLSAQSGGAFSTLKLSPQRCRHDLVRMLI
jgi:hypothetical protein